MSDNLKKPEWLRVKYSRAAVGETAQIMSDLGLNTVCREANCPNMGECFAHRTATFMILGSHCTRNCRFCNVTHAAPDTLDADEPESVAAAVKKLGLRHAVVTSVTRDDLPDGGAAHFAEVIRAIHVTSPGTTVEVLIPDFKGDMSALDTVLDARPEVLGHNVETVERLYGEVRPGADYRRSLSILQRAHGVHGIYTKTGFLVGLGEERDEVSRLMRDIYSAGCDILTIGQYLRPSEKHAPLVRYVTPDEFADYRCEALEIGFGSVVSAPLVRSSYMAHRSLEELSEKVLTSEECAK